MSALEPWMRGAPDGVHDPILAAVLHSFEHAREDFSKWTEGFTDAEMWESPAGVGSVGFHILHAAGSAERLLTYAHGRQLSESQLAELAAEKEGGLSRARLFEVVNAKFDACAALVRAFDPARFAETRYLGRKRIPVTFGGLLVHVAEHTQRHVGEAIAIAKLVKGGRA